MTLPPFFVRNGTFHAFSAPQLIGTDFSTDEQEFQKNVFFSEKEAPVQNDRGITKIFT